MRSFRLFLLLLSMGVVQVAHATENPVEKRAVTQTGELSFFTVVLPYDQVDGVKSPNALDQAIALGMQTLLVKITGQPRFLESAVGQAYLKSPRRWLERYEIKPRTEEGVQVGQNIELNFSAARLKAAFKQHRVPIWSLTQRPKTLVMGNFLQNGELSKLTQDRMRYRVDIEYRDYLTKMALPVTLPSSEQNWVFPVAPERTNTTIQEVLLTSGHDYLLSFKLQDLGAQALGDFKHELVWYLFAPSGTVFAQGTNQGPNKQALLQAMFGDVMQRYALFAEKGAREAQLITLNISNLFKIDQVQAVEAELAENSQMIKSVKLLSIQPGMAQFEIEYQTNYQTVVDWLRQWQKIDFVTQSEHLHQVDVTLRSSFHEPSASESSTAEKNEQNHQGIQ